MMDFSTPIDPAHLAALKKNCRQAQERTYRCFAPAAWTLAVRLCGCEARAWDAVQAGFVRAFERIGQLRQADRFGPWLKRIIIHQVFDQGRHSPRATPVDEPVDDRTAGAIEDRVDLEQALLELPAIDRWVVWLHDAEGLTHAEIAELSGQTVSWSKSRLARARARLRPRLNPEPNTVTALSR